jgi:diphosphomevalonate decarboxylase
MKVTAKAPANIAFIKYWGKKDEKLRIPANSSISMNLSEAYTVTSVESNEKFNNDEIFIDGEKLAGKDLERLSKHINLIRSKTKNKTFVRVDSKNNFPKGAGIASSASGFAALTVATSRAFGLNLSEKELSILARLGSGSACRSIPDGFVEWRRGDKNENSYAYSLYPPEYWNIYDVIAIVGEKGKKVSSTEGHALAESSPFYKSRIQGMPKKIQEMKLAMKSRDFTKFGEILEAEAINMHCVMMTSEPPLFYWLPETLEMMQTIVDWREKGLEVYFTIDAGPNVHVICEERNVIKVRRGLKPLGIKRIIVNKPAKGAELI